MNIKILSVGPFEVNCAIVWNMAKQAFVIDPGCDAADIETVLRENGLTVAAYLLTHGHTDHLNALGALYESRPAPVFIHAEDEKWAFSPQNEILPWYKAPEKPDAGFLNPETAAGRDAIEEIILKTGLCRFQCLETPGHTRGGVCYYFENEKVIFTGDTLFKGTCGRTDLPGGDARVLAASLKKLAALPDDVTVYPGHNQSTTIGCEKKTNFFMQQAGR
jgi:glyoxylase-like metal-dependent hydrolase (beta-lactamase superfamily II)